MFLRYFQDYVREWERRRPADAPAANNPGDGSDGRLLQKLSPRERVAISLSAFEDFNAREIAAALGCSENTARVHLFNARVKLKKEVADGL